MDTTKHILSEIQNINYQATEYINETGSVEYEDFIEYYKDFKITISQIPITNERIIELTNSMPELKGEKTIWLLIAAGVIFLAAYILFPMLYFIIILISGGILLLGIRYMMYGSRKNKVRDIIKLNEKIYSEVNLISN